MLRCLRVRNLAIIDELEVTLSPGLTVVTGETGAGKSILVNALNLVLGARARPEVVRAGAEQMYVGQFSQEGNITLLFADKHKVPVAQYARRAGQRFNVDPRIETSIEASNRPTQGQVFCSFCRLDKARKINPVWQHLGPVRGEPLGNDRARRNNQVRPCRQLCYREKCIQRRECPH